MIKHRLTRDTGIVVQKGRKQMSKVLLRDTGILVNAIDSYLITRKESDDRRRGRDIFSPSLIAGGCTIALILDKLGYNSVRRIPSPQIKRVFENGDYVHLRLQEYVKKSGLSKFQEVSLAHPTCGMYGTTDEVLYIPKYEEVIVADYKSCKQEVFDKELKGGALPSHTGQATMYTGMLELRRQNLIKTYKTEEELIRSTPKRIRHYRKNYFSHIRSGNKYSRREKLNHLISLQLSLDLFLFEIEKPITRFLILYENKNTQAMKEFVYEVDMDKFNAYVKMCEDTREWLNTYPEADQDNIEFLQRRHKILPKRPEKFTVGTEPCKWCNHKEFCYAEIEQVKTKAKNKVDNTNSRNPIARRKARTK